MLCSLFSGEDSNVVSEEEVEQEEDIVWNQPTLQQDQLKDQHVKSRNIDMTNLLLTGPRDRVERSLQQASQQLLAVQEAFAGDDVVEQFVSEKEEQVEKSRPKEIDLTLPGMKPKVLSHCAVRSVIH